MSFWSSKDVVGTAAAYLVLLTVLLVFSLVFIPLMVLLKAALFFLFLLGIAMVGVTWFMMERCVRREDAERPKSQRVRGGWQGLIAVAYFYRHGLTPMAWTFVAGFIIVFVAYKVLGRL
jgi:hypothetical protein